MLRAISLLVAMAVVTGAAQIQARVTGHISDGSGAGLPGVTVTISSLRLNTPIVLLTDASGRYTTPPLVAGTYSLAFELAGFESVASDTVDLTDGQVLVLDRRLRVAAVTETVEVVASAPPPPPAYQPPPRPVVQPVPQEILASVCGPGQPEGESLSRGTILGHRDQESRSIFGARDVVLLDLGSDFGASVGQNYVVRRRFRLGGKPDAQAPPQYGEQSAGLLQVVQTAPDQSVAVVVYACGELYTGDSIEAFDALPMWHVGDPGMPQFEEPGQIIFGEHGQSIGAARQLMVIDRGSAAGAARGQRLTIFRRGHGGRGPVSTVGDGIIVAVREHSATIRIERATDAVTVGDLVALHR